jgi:hypothetical protein
MRTSLTPLAADHQTPSLTLIERALVLALQLYGAIALIALTVAPHWSLPAEDAVILFQYSRNLANHGALTFLANGPHVEGATDFAWMVLVAAANRCGIPSFWFSAIVNVLSLALLSLLLLRLAQMRLTIPRVLAIAGAAALFPQIFAAAAGFAVLPDALLLTTLVLFVTRRRAFPASITALIFCMFRPDAIVFAAPLLAYLFSHTSSSSKKIEDKASSQSPPYSSSPARSTSFGDGITSENSSLFHSWSSQTPPASLDYSFFSPCEQA